MSPQSLRRKPVAQLLIILAVILSFASLARPARAGNADIEQYINLAQQLQEQYSQLLEQTTRQYNIAMAQGNQMSKYSSRYAPMRAYGRANGLATRCIVLERASHFFEIMGQRLSAPRNFRTLEDYWCETIVTTEGEIRMASERITIKNGTYYLGPQRLTPDGDNYKLNIDTPKVSMEFTLTQVTTECLAGIVQIQNKDGGRSGQAKVFLIRRSPELQSQGM